VSFDCARHAEGLNCLRHVMRADDDRTMTYCEEMGSERSAKPLMRF
jgi:hypothetical protein